MKERRSNLEPAFVKVSWRFSFSIQLLECLLYSSELGYSVQSGDDDHQSQAEKTWRINCTCTEEGFGS
jgi:hypothetical protein